MRVNSLALRLFLSAAAWTVGILLFTGVILSTVYQHAVERTFDRRLNLYLRTLIADIATPDDPNDKGNATVNPSLGEPLFELPLSGWYWQIARIGDAGADVRRSRSLWDRKLAGLEEQGVPLSSFGVRQGYIDGPENQRLRVIERPVDLGSDGRFLFTVAGDAVEIADETRLFNLYLGATFALLAAVLLVSALFQARFGLAPLRRLSQQLNAIRGGGADRLEGDFPKEIAPLARETNALLDANREIVERARTHVGNLAHALKTPLSVLVNEAALHPDNPLAGKIAEQAETMREQVNRHLERARLAARLSTLASVTDIAPVIYSFQRAMQKIHRERDLAIDVEVAAEARFLGERQDLEEMIGNLVDNACKWAQSRVVIEVIAVPAASSDQHPTVRICVDDDGPGLTPAQRDQVSRRGLRLDETKPGSGLGLSIVVDLAALYRGQLTLGAAPLGGLRAELILPAAPAS